MKVEEAVDEKESLGEESGVEYFGNDDDDDGTSVLSDILTYVRADVWG